MKILLIIILIIALLAVLGMFYWMYKSKSGELNLSTNSWHFKLKHWMWDFETYEGKNACPYYWGLVFSILILPLYVIIKYATEFSFYLNNKLPRFKKPTVLSKIQLSTIIPSTKKEMYSQIYKNSKKWLLNILFGSLIFIGFIGAVVSFYNLFILDWKIAVLVIILLLVIFLQVIMLIIENKYFMKNYWNYVLMIVRGLFGIFKLPFIMIYDLIKIPFQYLFKIYEDACPPINWN